LAIGAGFATLHHGDQREPPGRNPGLALMRREVREAVVLKDRPARIPQYPGGMGPLGKAARARRDCRHWGKRLRA
jgi:hypothetical protein